MSARRARKKSTSANAEVERQPKTTPTQKSRELHIYDGQTRLGKITIAEDTFTAFDASGTKLGVFADQAAAAFALGAAMKAGGRG